MISKWIYILVGNNNTGKTTFQRRLIYHFCDYVYKRLDRNVTFDIEHSYAPKKLKTLFLMSRSYQETTSEYVSVANYFENFFIENDVCILSSHKKIDDIKLMIEEGHKRKYNVCGIFWSNSSGVDSDNISLLNWDERFYFDNPQTDNSDDQNKQIDDLAWEFTELVVRRASIQ